MAEILQVDSGAPQPDRIARAAALITAGQAIAIPTDTVYGLAANPFDAAAVERIFVVKGRAPDAPVLVLVDSMEMAASLARKLPPAFHALAKHFWPGPLTIVVDAAPRLPGVVTANTGRIGMRLPAAEIPRALMKALGGPVTATSANRSGQGECRSAKEVEASLGERLPLILDGGPSGEIQPSTVISLTEGGWEMIREGAIGRKAVEDFFAAQNMP